MYTCWDSELSPAAAKELNDPFQRSLLPRGNPQRPSLLAEILDRRRAEIPLNRTKRNEVRISSVLETRRDERRETKLTRTNPNPSIPASLLLLSTPISSKIDSTY